MRIVFLDIDGVIMLFTNRSQFDPSCMQELKRLLITTNAKVVLSSNWKRSEENIAKLNAEFAKLSLAPVFSVTPEAEYDNAGLGASRLKEIEEWLKANSAGKVESWVALDDLNLQTSNQNLAFNGKFVCTNREKGLTKCVSNSNYIGANLTNLTLRRRAKADEAIDILCRI